MLDKNVVMKALQTRANGRYIRFRGSRRPFKYYQGPDGRQYFYSYRPDTKGRFWAWTYKIIGGQWRVVRLEQCARARVAMVKAFSRWSQANKKAWSRLKSALRE